MHKLEELKVWKKSRELTKRVYYFTDKLPLEERFGLVSQIRRSAVSISSNIAEGAGRSTNGEFRNFLSIASGSSYELYTQLLLCSDLNLIDKEETEPIIKEVIEIQKMIYALIKYLKST